MAQLWNRRTLQPPPMVTFAVENNRQAKAFLKCVANALDTLKETAALSTEFTILDRLLYKFNNQLRKEKMLQSMKMIRQSLKRLAEMDLRKEFAKFCDERSGASKTAAKIYLPSRDMLQYLLVRLTGYAHLLVRVGVCCQEAFLQCLQKLGRGDMVSQVLLFAAVVSRIWVLSKALVFHVMDWYRDLYSYLDILEGTQMPWLAEKDSLPPDLQEQLQIQDKLAEPKGMESFYNLEAGNQTKVDINQLLSKFRAPSTSPSPLEVTVTDKEYTSGEGILKTEEPEESSDERVEKSDGNEIGSMDINDSYDYGMVEDVGVSVKIERGKVINSDATSKASSEKAAPLNTGSPVISKEKNCVLTAKEAKCVARQLIKDGVTKCDDAMDKKVRKFVKKLLLKRDQGSVDNILDKEKTTVKCVSLKYSDSEAISVENDTSDSQKCLKREAQILTSGTSLSEVLCGKDVPLHVKSSIIDCSCEHSKLSKKKRRKLAKLALKQKPHESENTDNAESFKNKKMKRKLVEGNDEIHSSKKTKANLLTSEVFEELPCKIAVGKRKRKKKKGNR